MVARLRHGLPDTAFFKLARMVINQDGGYYQVTFPKTKKL